MLYRKIRKRIEDHLKSGSDKILLINGARQIGKTYIIRDIGNELFSNFIELNMVTDFLGEQKFKDVRTINDFYIQTSLLHGSKMKEKENTLIFIDEIQVYPELLTLLKFLREDNRFTFIASGSLLGVTLAQTTSIPIGSIQIIEMYPLDFEEFLIANGMNEFAINFIKEKYLKRESLDLSTHNHIFDLFKKYLIVGGLPDSINIYLNTFNIKEVRDYQTGVQGFYAADASKYDEEHKLKIRRIYDMLPSNLENKKKRVVVQKIEDKKGKKFDDYEDEFDYLINAGIALDVKAISQPSFPLIQSMSKNLLKLYLNDVGILTNILYKDNENAILQDIKSINLGTVYENVVAQELKAHDHRLFYYDNRNNGEVDFLVDDYDSLSVLPIEIKSGKDYQIHSALNKFLKNENYNIKYAYVLSNNREVSIKNNIIYLPIYYAMFI